MKLFVLCALFALAFAEEKEKRGADVQYATTSKPAYASVTASTITASATPSYATLSKAQAYKTQSYIQQPSVAYEAQPVVKYAYSAQPAYKVQAYQHPQVDYQGHEQQLGTYVQPEVKYISQPAVQKLAAAPAKIQYQVPAAVAYQHAGASSGLSSLSHGAPVAQHYSPASSVSSFHFSNPHVTYSNLGLLSQVIGKAASANHGQSAHLAAYSAQPAAQHYVSAAPQVQYVSQAAPVHQSVAAPSAAHQYTVASPHQYTIAAPQYQSAGHQYTVAAPSSAHQYTVSAPQYIQAAHQYSLAAPTQYVQQAAHSAPQYYYSSAPKGYTAGLAAYAH